MFLPLLQVESLKISKESLLNSLIPSYNPIITRNKGPSLFDVTKPQSMKSGMQQVHVGCCVMRRVGNVDIVCIVRY